MSWTQFALLASLVAANTLGVGMLIPQAVRLVRTGDATGVSATWIGVGIAINLGWLTYGLDRGLWGMVPVSIASAVVYGAMAVRLRRIDRSEGLRAVVAAGGLVVVLASTASVAGTAGLGLLLAALYSFQFAPAAVSAFTAPTVSGIARSTWVMALAEALLWAGYGIAVADLAVFLGGAGAAVMSAVILIQLAAKAEPSESAPVQSMCELQPMG